MTDANRATIWLFNLLFIGIILLMILVAIGTPFPQDQSATATSGLEAGSPVGLIVSGITLP